MDKREWKKIEEIVDEALKRSGQERIDYLHKKCGTNKQLKEKVTEYLSAIEQSKGFLENDEEIQKELLVDDYIDDPATAGSSFIGSVIGNYKITELLGYGGLGTVFLAERADKEFEHRVALKVLRRGMDTPKNISRFQLEREILAELSHPNIAQLYDGGVTDDGLPYLVMEYINGTPIDIYCDENQLSLKERIGLFKEVCKAVQYAHNNLIIHRDLKPGNILVTDQGNVKVLDFGISKLITDDIGESSAKTQKSHQMLTPGYAAPEQFSYRSITTAIDSYALGALLYKLLTGVTVFNQEGKNRSQIETLITKKMPMAPSKRLTKIDDGTQKKIATNRNTTPKNLISKLKGDLDAIILKAVSKDAGIRYESPNHLVEDINHHLNGEPVEARSANLTYYFSKFVKRNKLPIAATTAIILLTVSFGIFYTYQISQERNQAQLQAERAERERERAQQITDFLVSILELNNPSESTGADITVQDALNRGINNLEQQNMNPQNRAIILGTIGSIQQNIGDIDEGGNNLKEAMTLVRDSINNQTTQSLAVGTELAEWHTTVGQNEQAEYIFGMTDSLFHEYNLTGTTKYRTHLLQYSDFLLESGQYSKTLDILNELETSLDNISSITQTSRDCRSDMYNSRGRAYKNMGENKKALDNLDKALQIKEDIYDQNNPKIAKLYHNMGVVYGTIGEFKNARKMAEKSYQIKREVFEPTHQLVGSTLHLLGNISMELGNYDKALDYTQRSVEINRKKHGTEHFRYALALREYAKVLSRKNRFEEARQTIDNAASIIETNFGTNHPYYGYIMNTSGDIYHRAGKLQRALKDGDKTIAIFLHVFGDSHPNLGRAYANQGKYALKNGQYELADSLLSTSVHILDQHFDKANPYLKEADSLLEMNTNKMNKK